MHLIQILGTGCPKCERLAYNAKTAADELGIDYKMEKVEDISEIMGFGVMMTPAFVLNGVVKASGKVLSVEDIKKILA